MMRAADKASTTTKSVTLILSIYYPIICQNKTSDEISRMEEENALPNGWENMAYDVFLVERRKLMAAKIKQAYEILKSNI